jgi:DnaJ-domain-containing protein 1
MKKWRALLFLLGAVLYVILPWDLDYIPFVGRIDDLVLFLLALAYYWRQARTSSRPSAGGAGGRARSDSVRGDGKSDGEENGDPYRVLGVQKSDSDETIKRAYRDALTKYHPDRVQHLGEEFRQIAARRTVAINRAFEEIGKERG